MLSQFKDTFCANEVTQFAQITQHDLSILGVWKIFTLADIHTR